MIEPPSNRARVTPKAERFLPRVGLVYPLIFVHFGSRLFPARSAAIVAALASLCGIPLLTWLSRAFVGRRANVVGVAAMISAIAYAAITLEAGAVPLEGAELPATVRIARAVSVAMLGLWGYVWVQSRRA